MLLQLKKFLHFQLITIKNCCPRNLSANQFAAPNPKNLDRFSVPEFDPYQKIMSFPNGSGACRDKTVLEIFEDLVGKSNFLRSLTKLTNLIRDGKITKPLKVLGTPVEPSADINKGGVLRPIAIGNTLKLIARVNRVIKKTRVLECL